MVRLTPNSIGEITFGTVDGATWFQRCAIVGAQATRIRFPPMVDPPMVDPPMVDPPMVDPSMDDPPMVDPLMVDPPMVAAPMVTALLSP